MADPLTILHAAREGYLRTRDRSALEHGLAVYAATAWEDYPDALRREAVNLAAELRLRRYEHDGALEDLEAAIAAWDALLAAPDAPHRLAALSNRATALAARVDVSRDERDLDAAVEGFRAALELATSGSELWAQLQGNLGGAQLTRLELGGSPEALDESIEALGAALGVPATAEERAGLLTNLGLALHARWSLSGGRDDLGAAIAALSSAVATEPHESAQWALFAANLAIALHDRHVATGALADLERTLELDEDVLARTPERSPLRASAANNLASALHSRYAVTGDLADLDRCGELAAAAVRDAGEDPEYLGTLGVVHETRYARSADRRDLERAADCYRRACRVTAEAVPGRGRWLTNLGNVLSELGSLDEAVALHEQAVAIMPEGAPDRAAYLANLAVCLLDRGDLDGSVGRSGEALAALADGSPERPAVLANLALALHRGGSATDRRRAGETFAEATAAALPARSETALIVAGNWSEWAFDARAWREAADALDVVLSVLRRLFAAQASRAHRETWLRAARHAPADAAWAHSRCEQPHDAATAIELGRALLLSDALERDRAEVSALASVRPDLASRFGDARGRVASLEASPALHPVRPAAGEARRRGST